MRLKDAKTLKTSAVELNQLQQRLQQRCLLDSDYGLLDGLTQAVQCLTDALSDKDTSLGRLCKYLLGAPTETARNVLKLPKPPAEPKPPAKGHGRNPTGDYKGADTVVIEHEQLKTGDRCPDCDKGKLYELAMPSVVVQVVGQAPLKATVYERTRLRCNLCGQIITPALPANVGNKKHDESAAAMVAMLKYGCGLPLHRIEKLQASLDNPLPASTQWDILNAAARLLEPVYDTLVDRAAQGELIHNDDTTMKVLAYLNQQDAKKGVYTTGIVSHCQGRQIGLFLTGDKHAGQNLTDLLQHRAAGLSAPIQMCDAASRNGSKEFDTIMANCLAHARRQFVEIVDRFPEQCAYVIEQLGSVYHHETLAQQQQMDPARRLAYHQQHSGPVMGALETWCHAQMDTKAVEPNSGLGKAIRYLLKHWDKLTRFLQAPGAPLDNNICERALKFAILHRKNALFFKTQRGAKVGDMFMSLIHTCQLAGINPLAYLTWLLKNAATLKDCPQNFLPWNFQPDTS